MLKLKFNQTSKKKMESIASIYADMFKNKFFFSKKTIINEQRTATS